MTDSPALARLRSGHFNTGDWNAATNPGGMGGDGHRYAMVPPKAPQVPVGPVLVTDFVTIATEMVANADTAATQAGLATSEANRALALAGTAISGTGTGVIDLPAVVGTILGMTLSTGKAWVAGHLIDLVPLDAPASGQRVRAVITAYNAGTGAAALIIKASQGTGTVSSWAVRATADNPLPFGSVIRSLTDLTSYGYVPADGRAVDRTGTYAELFNAIGQRFSGLAEQATLFSTNDWGGALGGYNDGDVLFYADGLYTFFALGRSGVAMWQGATLATLAPVHSFPGTLYGVARSSTGVCVVTLDGSRVMVGSGTSWTLVSNPWPWRGNVAFRQVIWSPTRGAFYAFPDVSGNGTAAAKSLDGVTWTQIALPSGYAGPKNAAVYAGRVVLACSSNTYCASPDGGDTWQTGTLTSGYSAYGVAPYVPDATGNSWLFVGGAGTVSVAGLFGSPTNTANSAATTNNDYSINVVWDTVANRFVWRSDNDATRIYYTATFPVTGALTYVTRSNGTAGADKGRILVVNGQLVEITNNRLSTLNASFAATLAFGGWGAAERVRRLANGQLVAFTTGWVVHISSDEGASWVRRRPSVGFGDAAYMRGGEVSADGQTIVLFGLANPNGGTDASGVIWSSGDAGVSWTRSVLGSSGNSINANSNIVYGDGKFVVWSYDAVGATAKIYYAAQASVSSAWSTTPAPIALIASLIWTGYRWLLFGASNEVQISTGTALTSWAAFSSQMIDSAPTIPTILALVGGLLFYRFASGSTIYIRAVDTAAPTPTVKTLWTYSSTTVGRLGWEAYTQYGTALHIHAGHSLWGYCLVRLDLTTLTVIETLPPPVRAGLSVPVLPGAFISGAAYTAVGGSVVKYHDGGSSKFRLPNLSQDDDVPAYIALYTVQSGLTGGAPAPAPVPVPEIRCFAGAVPPTGWVLCDGSAVSRTAWPTLFAALGTSYGPGDGSTTFNVPVLPAARRPVPAGGHVTEVIEIEGGGSITLHFALTCYGVRA